MTPSSILRTIKAIIARRSIRDLILKSNPLRIVVGAGGTEFRGWTSTDYPLLDIVDHTSWLRLVSPGTIGAVMAEHVFEHLSGHHKKAAFENSFKFMKSGGYLRIAVPYAFHPNHEYINLVKPGGSGEGAKDHKQLFNAGPNQNLLRKQVFL